MLQDSTTRDWANAGLARGRSRRALAPRSAEEQVLFGLSLIGLFGLMPFAYLHFAEGRLLMGLLVIWVMAVGASIAAYVWVTRNVRLGGSLFALVYMLGMVAVVHVSGVSLLYWAYPAMAGAYFFVPLRRAIALNVLALLAIIPVAASALESTEVYRVILSLVMTNLIACLFADRMIKQRELLTSLATRDPLTGVGNRRALQERMRELAAMSERRGDPCSMLMLDVDLFKRINDSVGHNRGDQVLASLANVLGNRIRLTDSLYRFGGDEFVILLSDTNEHAAAGFAEQLRKLVESSADCFGQALSVSLGVAQLQRDESTDAWFQRADVALYQAKHAGRNTVRVA